MTKSALFQAMEREAKAEIDQIITEGQQRCDIFETALKDLAVSLTAETELSAKLAAEQACEQLETIVTADLLQRQQVLLQQFMDETRQLVITDLQNLRSEPERYHKVFLALIREALEAIRVVLPAEPLFLIKIDPLDADLMIGIESTLETKFRYETSITTWGGAIVSDPAETVCMDNRLEARLSASQGQIVRRFLPELEGLIRNG